MVRAIIPYRGQGSVDEMAVYLREISTRASLAWEGFSEPFVDSYRQITAHWATLKDKPHVIAGEVLVAALVGRYVALPILSESVVQLGFSILFGGVSISSGIHSLALLHAGRQAEAWREMGVGGRHMLFAALSFAAVTGAMTKGATMVGFAEDGSLISASAQEGRWWAALCDFKAQGWRWQAKGLKSLARLEQAAENGDEIDAAILGHRALMGPAWQMRATSAALSRLCFAEERQSQAADAIETLLTGFRNLGKIDRSSHAESQLLPYLRAYADSGWELSGLPELYLSTVRNSAWLCHSLPPSVQIASKLPIAACDQEEMVALLHEGVAVWGSLRPPGAAVGDVVRSMRAIATVFKETTIPSDRLTVVVKGTLSSLNGEMKMGFGREAFLCDDLQPLLQAIQPRHAEAPEIIAYLKASTEGTSGFGAGSNRFLPDIQEWVGEGTSLEAITQRLVAMGRAQENADAFSAVRTIDTSGKIGRMSLKNILDRLGKSSKDT